MHKIGRALSFAVVGLALAGLARAEEPVGEPAKAQSGLLAFAPSFVPQSDPSIQLNRIFDAAGSRIFWPMPWPKEIPQEASEAPKTHPKRRKPAHEDPTNHPGIMKAYKRTFNILMARQDRIDRFDAAIVKESVKYGLNPCLLKAIIAAESEFSITARSPAGALGLMQVMPATAEGVGVHRSLLLQPESNIAAGAAYLAYLFKTLYKRHDLVGIFSHAPQWAVKRVIAAYNAGTRFLNPRPLYTETSLYVAKVLLYRASDVARIRKPRPEPA